MDNLKDAKTLAYINMHAILGTLGELCSISPAAAVLAKPEQPIVLGLSVRNGPAATMSFDNGVCKVYEGRYNSDILLFFNSDERFNGMIEGTVNPFPSKGLTKIWFLTKNFTTLTDILEKYLKADSEDMKSESFAKDSTCLMFRVITHAIPQIANYDHIGRFTASNMVNGTILIAIKGGPKAALEVKDHRIKILNEVPDEPTAIMEFKNMQIARSIFDGQENTLACTGLGLIELKGHIGLLDNLNRLLDRVAVYLS